ncbi:MAG: TetR/AcrR family transcriptional regulator [Pseudomonadota bacterium]
MSARRDPESTRKRLIEAAFSEIHLNGFQGMRVDDVLAQAGLRKGALYHHFGSKAELGYAVLDQIVRKMIDETWLAPLRDVDDPVTALKQQIIVITAEIRPDSLKLGCPLNNLAQEMSPVDEGFRTRVTDLFEYWIGGFTAAFKRGQEKGYVRDDIDTTNAARFLVSSLEGCIGIAKAQQSKEHLEACGDQVVAWLDSLRAPS